MSNLLSCLKKVFFSPNGSIIGADPSLIGAHHWLKWEKKLSKEGNFTLKPLLKNPIDEIWTDQPARNTDPLKVHDLQYAGQSWQDKISELRSTLNENGHDAIVLTGLDETAWIFNLRGQDIPYTPVFRSYAIVDEKQIILYIEPEKQTENVKEHLNSIVKFAIEKYKNDHNKIFNFRVAILKTVFK